MPSTATHRGFKRRIVQLERRMRTGVGISAEQVARELSELLIDLRRAAEREPEIAVELALSVLATLPRLCVYLDDRGGLIADALALVPDLIVDLLHDDAQEEVEAIDRFSVLERLFRAWLDDESGYLRDLDEALIAAARSDADEKILVSLCQLELRGLPAVFPPAAGQKLDLDRVLLHADRYAIERLLGALYARRGQHDFAVIVAHGHYRLTGDAVDFVEALSASGRSAEAIEFSRRILRTASAPRHAELRAILERLIAADQSDGDGIDDYLRLFEIDPSLDTYFAISERLPLDEWTSLRGRLLDDLRQREGATDVLFDIVLAEGDLLEADALVTSRHISPRKLADAAELILADNPETAAGWLLIASFRLLDTEARRSSYDVAATWLATVGRIAEVTGQLRAFRANIAEFRDRYRRRPTFLRLLDDYGL